MIVKQTSKTKRRSSSGFTLVEILVVLIIIGVMSVMVLSAVNGVTNSARSSRTRTIIATIDSVIQEQYESFKYRPLPVEIVDMSLSFDLDDSAGELSREVLAEEAARVRLWMLRDLQRMEMPDRYSDITNGPIQIYAAANLVKIDDDPSSPTYREIIGTRALKSSRYPVIVSPVDSAKRVAYNSRLRSSRTTLNQSAECLYLIMANAFVGGTPAIDMIPSSNIGDTDGDGMAEILDGWGQPIGFIRWPVGYNDPTGALDVTVPDEFDLFRSDFAYSDIPGLASTPSTTAVVRAVSVNDGQSRVFPWSLRPLVISAGSDGDFGITFNPIQADGTELDTFSYVSPSWKWLINPENMGTEEVKGRTLNSGTYNYIAPDPYMRQFIRQNDPTKIVRSDTNLRRLIGEQLSVEIASVLADNITNFALQESQ